MKKKKLQYVSICFFLFLFFWTTYSTTIFTYKISYYNLCITYECRVRECQNLWNIHSTEMSIHRTKKSTLRTTKWSIFDTSVLTYNNCHILSQGITKVDTQSVVQG